jgi:hypothetical protein
MALIKCSECGRDISEKASACPGCGGPVIPVAPPVNEGAQRTTSSPSWVIGIVAVILGIASIFTPYFAAVFLIPAAFVCGVIAFRRGQKTAGSAGIILAVLGLVWIVSVSQQITNIARDPFAPNPLTSSGSPPVVALAKYNAIREGMSYQEVTSIIGVQGQELSRSDLAEYTTVMYSWSNSNGSNMNAMFQNGRLVNKAQFGLR